MKILQFYTTPDIESFRDAMQLDSGIEVASIEAETDNGLKIKICNRICGEVRVIFQDQTYKHASDMPEILLDCYRNGKDPGEAARKDALENNRKYETLYYVDNNNWVEEFVKVTDKVGKIIHEDSYVVDTPEHGTAEEWRKGLINTIRDIEKDLTKHYSAYITVRIDYSSIRELDGEDVQKLISNLECSFKSRTNGITIDDTEICGINE